MDRAGLHIRLEHLDAAVPALRVSSPDRRHFVRAFAGMPRVIKARQPGLVGIVARQADERYATSPRAMVGPGRLSVVHFPCLGVSSEMLWVSHSVTRFR